MHSTVIGQLTTIGCVLQFSQSPGIHSMFLVQGLGEHQKRLKGVPSWIIELIHHKESVP